MKLGDLTYGQMAILCRATDCEECDLRLTGKWEQWKCIVFMPRLLEETEAGRIKRFNLPFLALTDDRPRAIKDLDVPKAWERLLEAEHQLMLSLLEVKP